MSSITFNRASAEVFASFRYSDCSGSRSVSRVSSTIPITPFIGVRISWLMFARNSLFAQFAASAASLAARNSAASRLRAVISSAIPMLQSLFKLELITRTQMVSPSLRK